MVSGLTNQLMSNQQSLFISASLGLPFESMGFLDVGCFSAWPNCPINALVPISDVFDLESISRKLGIQWTQASKNYCYRHKFPANLSMNQLSFNASMFSIQGRTVVTPGWARYRTHGSPWSWYNFTKTLRSSLNHRILYHCNTILKQLPPFHCIHPRVDTDYIDKYDIGRKIINKDSKNDTTFYIVMRENSRSMYPQSKVGCHFIHRLIHPCHPCHPANVCHVFYYCTPHTFSQSQFNLVTSGIFKISFW